MTKCDFCTQSSPSGECCWRVQSSREEYCEEAIERMIRAIKDARRKEDTRCANKYGAIFR